MSYILDALRKADAQRERDPARGIHAQPLQGLPAPQDNSRMGRKALWASAAVGIAALTGAAWQVSRPVAPQLPPQPPAGPAARSMPQAPAPAAEIVPPPLMVAKAPAISTSIVRVQAAVQAPAIPARQASRSDPAPLITAPAATGQPPGMTPFHGPRSPGIAPMPANAPQPPRVPVPPAAPLPPAHGLPPDAPKVVINGGVYSANPQQRMLIVNGQVVKEGADLGSGLKLEQITAKTAVLGFRGARYMVGY